MNAVITSITGVFSAIMDWMASAIADITPIFYVAETGLTFIGTLTIIGLSISIFFLLVGVISSFLHLRG